MDSAPHPVNAPDPIDSETNLSAEIEDCYELSPLQQGMLFHALYSEQCGVDVEQIEIDLDELLNIPALEQAWQRVVARHGVLRTSFCWDGLKEPLQQVHRDIKISIEQHDWQGWSPAENAERMEAYLRSDRKRGFDLREAPLIRLALFRLGDTAFRFLWTFHHILLDGRSFAIVLNEVFASYEAICRGETLELPQLRPHRDYIEWIKQQDFSGAEEFWRSKLSGFTAPTPLLPARDPAEPPPTEAHAEEHMDLPEEFTTALADFAQRENLTLNTLIQGAWTLLLSKYTGEEDIVFGAIKTLRHSSLGGAESMVGMFMNAIPVRVRVPANITARLWLNQLRAEWLSLRPFEHTPLAIIKECSDVPAGASLFDSLIVFDHRRFDAVLHAEGGAWTRRRFRLLEKTNYRITLNVYGGREISLKIQWDPKHFEAPAIRRMLDHYCMLLKLISSDPTRRLSDLPLLTLPERHQILNEWNDTSTRYAADSCLHELIEAQVERTPENVALVYENQSWSYRELNALANQLARRLCALGVGPEVLVGLCLERSLEMVLGVLGILKAGGAYVPLDPAYPRERLAFMLEDSQVPLLLTQEHLLPSLPAQGARVVCLDRDWPSIATEEDTNIHGGATARNLAYVIYTSGSTGRPKAAQLEHTGLCNLAQTQARTCSVGPESRILQFCSLSFDPSIFDIAVALCSGAALCLAPQSSLVPGPAMARLLRDQAITMMTLPPSILAPLPDEPFPCLRTIVVGAEPCSIDVLHRWGKDRHFFDIYGVTEATVFSTIAECRDNGRRPHIGRPIANNQIYLLDGHLNPVPIGIPGKLYIGGVGLARGYLNRPELTAEKFIPHPFSDDPGARLYKTGDMARYLEDGNIEFLGRSDNQVKIRGYRIELEEIEALLENCPAVRESVVTVQEDIPGDRRLVAYVVPRQPSVSAAELRSFLAQSLPDYMVPTALVFLDALPLSPNGKVNRRALPKPRLAAGSTARESVAPRDHVEKLLATIWTQVLGVASVGVHDSFFHLGGDSILSIQVVGYANQAGIRLTPRQIFQHPTIAELARVVNLGPSPETKLAPVIGSAPPTPIQRFLFELDLPEPHHWNQAIWLKLKQPCDPGVIQQAIAELVLRHDALRLCFVREKSEWRQRTASAENNPVCTVVDLSQVSEAEQARAMEKAGADIQASLNLAAGPLMRAALFESGNGRPGKLLIVIHHLAVDYVSWGILLTEFESACQQIARGERLSLPPPTSSFLQWSQRQAEYAFMEAARRELPYWLEPHAGAAAIPFDHERGANTEASARTFVVSLTEDETRTLLRDVPACSGLQINDLLVTALARTLTQWTGQSSALVDMEGHGREQFFDDLDVSRTVGWFTSIFPMLLDLDGAATLDGMLRAIQNQLRAVPHHGAGYGVLRYLSQKEIGAQLSSFPPAQVSFNYLGQLDQILPRSEMFTATVMPTGLCRSSRGRRPHLLDIAASIAGGKLEVVWSYSENVHEQVTIARLGRNYIEVLRELIAHSGSSQHKTAHEDSPIAKLNPQQLAQAQRLVPDLVDAYRLSPVQQGMLYHSLREQASGVYIVQLSSLLEGHMDVSAFERAWQKVADRHAVLRTAFLWEGFEEPVQVVRLKVDLPVKQHDWTGRSEAEQRRQFETFLRNDRKNDFVLAQGPLVRLALIRLGTSTHRFVLTFHNLLLDGWSWPVVLKDALTYYLAYSQGHDAELKSVTPYREYITWLAQQDLAGAEAWWKKELSGFTTPTRFRLPQPVVNGIVGVGPAPPEGTGISAQEPSGAFNVESYAEQEFLLPESTTEALRLFARQHGLTLNTILQGAWGLLLSRYSGEEDVVFGTTLSGRPPALSGIDSVVGLCINTLPARLKLPTRASLLECLRDLQSHQAELRQYEFTPLVEVQRCSDVAPSQPLFESILVFQNYPLDPSLWECSGLNITDVRVLEQTNYPLTLAAVPGPRLSLTIGYACSRFESATVTRMLGHLQTLLQGMVANPHQELSSLSLFTSEERRLLSLPNLTHTEHPCHRCIHHLVETQVERTPEAVAVNFERTQLTYLQLNECANQLGNFLLKLGIGPEVPVGICLDRSPEMLVAILGVLKAGGAYVPLDPSYPRDRLNFMLQDCQAPVLITKQKYAAKFPEASIRLVCLDADSESISAENANECAGEADADNLAYIIYTSGSTGHPKGVLVNHANLVHSTSARTTFYRQPVGGFLLLSPFAFDSSLAGIFWTLATGGTLILPRHGLERDPLELARLIARKHITHLLSLPSLYDLLLAESAQLDSLSSLRCVIVAGERCPSELIARTTQLLPSTAIFNEYGPTEATVWSSVQNCESIAANAPVPIGRPIANAQIHLLDARLEPVPVGLPGELYVGGAGLARGYLNQPELTAEKFIPDLFSQQSGARLYRTGDLARYRDDYTIEFLGRLDQQVKIRGFRIELEEIEAVLASHPRLRQAAVVVRDDGNGSQRVWAYFVADETPPDSAQLGEFLASKLPDHMLPVRFIRMEALPLRPNGKVDRQALLALKPDFCEASLKLAPPRDDLEFALQQIWEKVLGVRPVGVTDNFFTLGGHSLLAVRLVSQVHKVLCRSLALSSFFQAPTIAQMAVTLRSEQGLAPRPCVPIRPFGSRPVFFAAGSDPGYIRLAEHLGPDQPFYRLDVCALQERRLVDGHELYCQVEAMAAAFVKEIESVQATGPYFLGGGCEGAIVSLEIARQLQARGAEVAMLAIWQTPPAENWDWLLYAYCRVRRAALLFAHHASELATFGLRRTTRDSHSRLSQDLLDALRLEHITIFTVRAVRSYVSRSFQGRITLFRAQEQSRHYPTQAEDWERLAADGLEVHVIPGNRASCFAEHLADFAARLKICLDRAQAMADKPHR